MSLTTLVKPSEVQKSPQSGQQHHCSSVWDPCTLLGACPIASGTSQQEICAQDKQWQNPLLKRLLGPFSFSFPFLFL